MKIKLVSLHQKGFRQHQTHLEIVQNVYIHPSKPISPSLFCWRKNLILPTWPFSTFEACFREFFYELILRYKGVQSIKQVQAISYCFVRFVSALSFLTKSLKTFISCQDWKNAKMKVYWESKFPEFNFFSEVQNQVGPIPSHLSKLFFVSLSHSTGNEWSEPKYRDSCILVDKRYQKEYRECRFRCLCKNWTNISGVLKELSCWKASSFSQEERIKASGEELRNVRKDSRDLRKFPRFSERTTVFSSILSILTLHPACFPNEEFFWYMF